MLPSYARLRRSTDFRWATRRGVRGSRPTVVVHLGWAESPSAVTRVGFVVGKGVGNAVTRNRVKRRLRHLAAAWLARTPDGVDAVVRALPRSASTPDRLSEDLAGAWSDALRRLPAGRPGRTEAAAR